MLKIARLCSLRRLVLSALWLAISAFANLPLPAQQADAVARIGHDIEFFSSDALEGRGVETKGIELAADYILKEYQKAGLKPALPSQSYRQAFNISLGDAKVLSDTAVTLQHAADAPLALTAGKQFQPLLRGSDGECSGQLVFVGYGITSDTDMYDDYAGINVRDRIVVMIRREPQQGQVEGAFLGTETSTHSYINRKLELAKKNGAAGIIFVNDPFTCPTAEKDDLSEPRGFGTSEIGIPFVHVRQAVLNRVLTMTPLIVTTADQRKVRLDSLEKVCAHIDQTMTPISQIMPSWSADVATHFQMNQVTAFNLIGVLEGSGPLADETIVVGGHYDHLGYGGYGSRAKNRTGEIHNGADDNASGTAAVLEMIRRLTVGPAPRRRIVFICFSGEERGLLGSNYYVQNPVFPLEKTVAMLNFDMIGTVRNNQVEVNGIGSATEFQDIVTAADTASAITVKSVDNPFGGSDHLPFYRRQIPVMFCFSGTTPRYHTPDDDFKTINVAGVAGTVDLSERILRSIDSLAERPTFNNLRRNSRSKPPFLGVMPNLGADNDEPGVPLQGIRENSPAAVAGFQVGDVIVKANATVLDGYADLLQFMRNAKPGQTVKFIVTRGTQTRELTATLAAPR